MMMVMVMVVFVRQCTFVNVLIVVVVQEIFLSRIIQFYRSTTTAAATVK